MIECPSCGTNYPYSLIGGGGELKRNRRHTVRCTMCHCSFEFVLIFQSHKEPLPRRWQNLWRQEWETVAEEEMALHVLEDGDDPLVVGRKRHPDDRELVVGG